jgi:hypothetical protein
VAQLHGDDGQQVEDECADGGSLMYFLGRDAFGYQQGSQTFVGFLPLAEDPSDVEPDPDSALGDAD